MLTTPEAAAETITSTFGAHHRRLDRLFAGVASALRIGDWAAARDGWATLDRELTAHLALEEREMLPRFAAVDPAAAQELGADHAEFRHVLEDLGTALDLKRLTVAVADDFFDRLARHAAREEALLYRWADRAVEPRAGLLARLRRAIGR